MIFTHLFKFFVSFTLTNRLFGLLTEHFLSNFTFLLGPVVKISHKNGILCAQLNAFHDRSIFSPMQLGRRFSLEKNFQFKNKT